MVTRLSSVRSRHAGTDKQVVTVIPCTPRTPRVPCTLGQAGQVAIGKPSTATTPRLAGQLAQATPATATTPRMGGKVAQGTSGALSSRARCPKVDSFREDKAKSTMATGLTHFDLKARLDALAAFCRGELDNTPTERKMPVARTTTRFDTSPQSPQLTNTNAPGGNLERKRLDAFLSTLYVFMNDLQVDIVPHTEYRAHYDPQGPLRLFINQALHDSRPMAPMAEPGFLAQTVLLALSPDSAFNFDYNNKAVFPCDCAESHRGKGATTCQFPFDSVSPEQRIFHYPAALCEEKNEVNVHFRALMKKIPSKLQEFLGFVWPVPAKQFAKFQMSIASYLLMFDFYYSRFERLYLDLVNRVLLRAYEPLVGIHAVCCSVDDIASMKQLDLALFCQNLGVASREIDFGVPVRTEYDPKIIVKAMRVLYLSTYKEIQAKAQRLLSELAKLHSYFRGLDFKNGVSGKLVPNLAANELLVEVFRGTQAEWDTCVIILQQATLDFFTILLDGWLMQKLNANFRKKLRIGASQTQGKFCQEAHQALYVDFPILLLLDELYSSMNNKTSTNFKDTFLVSKQSTEAEERLHRVKGEIGKFDERRYQTLFQYTLGVATPQDQLSYFENLYSQLKNAANIENTKQWLVMNRILQDICDEVEPKIFPRDESASSPGRATRTKVQNNLSALVALKNRANHRKDT